MLLLSSDMTIYGVIMDMYTIFFFLLISRIMSDESHYQPLMLTCNVPEEKWKRTENIFILALAITASALMLYSDKMR